jgi:hypothetical protein
MKIWGNDLEIGQDIYYEDNYEIKQGKVIEKDFKTFRMPSLILDNKDRIFVNKYYYTDKQEMINEVIEDLKIKCNEEILSLNKSILIKTLLRTSLENKLKKLNEYETK